MTEKIDLILCKVIYAEIECIASNKKYLKSCSIIINYFTFFKNTINISLVYACVYIHIFYVFYINI